MGCDGIVDNLNETTKQTITDKSIKVLFTAPLDPEAGVHNWGCPSLGIMRIDAFLKEKVPDVQTIIYDPSIDKYDPLETFRNEHIDFLGISLLHYTLIESITFMHHWKAEHPETTIVCGGNEAAANYQDVLDKSPTDFIVLVEGEQVMVDLVLWKQGKKRLEDIPGIIYRKYAEPITDDRLWDFWKYVDFTQYRYPDYWQQIADMYEKPDYEKVYYVRLVTSSHCLRNCTFCSLYLVRNMACGMRSKPASLKGWQLMEIINRIKKQLPKVRTIYFCTDDVFYPNKQDFYEFADLYEKSGYDYRILVQTSTYSVKEKEFELLKRIGCQHITFGIENASERMRDSLCKKQDPEKIENIIKWGEKYDIPVYFLIILIPPESTMEDLKINYEVINRWVRQGVQISIEPLIYAYRGTAIYEDDSIEFSYQSKPIPGTKMHLKDSIYALPKDPVIRKLALEFKECEPEYVKQAFARMDNKHQFKGQTSYILLELLGELIKKYEGITA